MLKLLSPILLVLFITLSNSAVAHQLSTAYLNVDLINTNSISGNLQIGVLDLEYAIGLDANQDQDITWGEILEYETSIRSYINSHVSFDRDQLNCPINIGEAWKVDSHYNENYLVLPISAYCSSEGALSISYSAVFDEDSEHKLLANININDSTHTFIFSKGSQKWNFNPIKSTYFDTFKQYITQGFVHILIGPDHLLFIVSLLLFCVFRRPTLVKAVKGIPPKLGDVWVGTSRLRRGERYEAFVECLKVISMFTLAHSITLLLSAMNWISVSSRWTEIIIALTVVFAALNNMFPVIVRIWWPTFIFGLIHGLGFASVLSELNLAGNGEVLMVLAFNLGVEIGQIFVVFCVLPILYVLAINKGYQRYWLNGGSGIIALIGLHWMIQRI